MIRLIEKLEQELSDLRSEVLVLRLEVQRLNGTFRSTGIKAMTENDARRVVFGDLANVPVKDAAEKLGLSYGQVYSAKNGYTFKTVYAEKLGAIESVTRS